MFPSAGQTGENEGVACPQCGKANNSEVFYCYNCRYPLHTVRLKREAITQPGSNGKNEARTTPPMILESERPTQPRRRPVPIPWTVIGLSWLLLGAAYAVASYALSARMFALDVLAFFAAMVAVGLGSALLRERSRLARISGWLVILVYLTLQVLAIRAILPFITAGG